MRSWIWFLILYFFNFTKNSKINATEIFIFLKSTPKNTKNLTCSLICNSISVIGIHSNTFSFYYFSIYEFTMEENYSETSKVYIVYFLLSIIFFRIWYYKQRNVLLTIVHVLLTLRVLQNWVKNVMLKYTFCPRNGTANVFSTMNILLDTRPHNLLPLLTPKNEKT